MTAFNLISELNSIISSFLCGGEHVEMEKYMGSYIHSKGGFQPVCIVKLQHGKIYHLEFVYKFLTYKLKANFHHSSLYFIISNNGIASTLKIFLREPVGELGETKFQLPMKTDVMLPRNASIVISQDDFIKFKSPLLPPHDINLFRSLVVCRAYLTDKSSNMQFLIFQPGSCEKLSYLLKMIVGTQEHILNNQYESRAFPAELSSDTPVHRRPIRGASNSHMRRFSNSSDSDGDMSDTDLIKVSKPENVHEHFHPSIFPALNQFFKLNWAKICLTVILFLCLMSGLIILITSLVKI